MGGTPSITGEEGGGPPVRVGFSIGDIGGGIFTALGILAALHERQRSGQGQKLDVAMLDCQMALAENAMTRFFATGEVPRRSDPPPGAHPVPGAADERRVHGRRRRPAGLVEKFCKLLKREDLIADERFKTNPDRTKNHKALEEILSAATRTRNTADWVSDMEKLDVACGPLNAIPQVAADPNTAARDIIREVKHSTAGMLKVVNNPVKLSRTPVNFKKPRLSWGRIRKRFL